MLLKAEKIDNKTDEKKSKKHGAWKNNKWVAQQKIMKNLYTNIMIDNWAKYMEDLFIEVIDDINDMCLQGYDVGCKEEYCEPKIGRRTRFCAYMVAMIDVTTIAIAKAIIHISKTINFSSLYSYKI